MAPLAVLSDLHANLGALRAVSEDLERRGLGHRVLVLGDLVGYLTRPNQVATWVEQRGWQSLAGNYDRAVLAGGNPGIEPPYGGSFPAACRAIKLNFPLNTPLLAAGLFISQAWHRSGTPGRFLLDRTAGQSATPRLFGRAPP